MCKCYKCYKLARVVLGVKGDLVIRLGSDHSAGKESAVETLRGFLERLDAAKLDKYLDNDMGVLLVALPLLVDDHAVYVAVFATLVRDLVLELFVNVLGADHVAENEDARCRLTTLYVLCFMYYVLCIMFYVLCISFKTGVLNLFRLAEYFGL